MKVIYTGEPMPTEVESSMFLVGPSPRSNDVPSWRPAALDYLRKRGYNGTVFVPEARDGEAYPDYDSQVGWEDTALNFTDCIVCWIPRDLETMPAFTTNTEFGEWFKSGKMVYGAPQSLVDGVVTDAPKTKYQTYKALEANVYSASKLETVLDDAMKFLDGGDLRGGGQCQVPLYIWRTDEFQTWFCAHDWSKLRFDGAKVVWTHYVGPNKKLLFFWALEVDIYIASENRNKKNELIISRPDIASAVLYKKAEKIQDWEIVLVKEFRSACVNENGFVLELPGGSSQKPMKSFRDTIVSEIGEETGLSLRPGRLHSHFVRQMVSTMSIHCSFLYSAELTDSEMDFVKSQEGKVQGVEEDTERTYIEVWKYSDIMTSDKMDWSMIGMINQVVFEKS